MTRILIPTDFSANAMHAATYATQLFGIEDATYVLVHSHFDPGVGSPLAPFQLPELIKAAEEGLATVAKQFVQRTGARSVEQHVLYGALAPALNEFMKEKKTDLVVMGKRGSTGSALFGSNTTDVLKTSSVPVLAVPEKALLRPLKRILLADDHDEVLPESLDMLRSIAMRQKAEIIVSHMPVGITEGEDHWSNGLYAIALKGIPHSFIEGYGHDVVDGIERTAHKRGADMVAVLHRHRGLLDRILHTSTAKELALELDMPLLVLEQKA
ncbi:MAG: universal stress protein [Flavobacteriales bacterium]|nr:universal stress protein [Flavobacteriales bacterium]